MKIRAGIFAATMMIFALLLCQSYTSAQSDPFIGQIAALSFNYAELLKRVFAVDSLKCERCSAKMRILCAIHPPEAIKKILECLGIPSKPPPIFPEVLESDTEDYIN